MTGDVLDDNDRRGEIRRSWSGVGSDGVNAGGRGSMTIVCGSLILCTSNMPPSHSALVDLCDLRLEAMEMFPLR
nr:hypothetical protein CFP56_57851 [Quercus suber]